MSADKQLEFSEEQMLKMLLEESQRQETVILPLTNGTKIPITLKALTDKEVAAVRDRCTYKIKEGRAKVDKLDSDEFNAALVVAATVKPNWGNPNILSEYKLSSAEEVVKRIAGGYLNALCDRIMTISGFDIEVEEVKN